MRRVKSEMLSDLNLKKLLTIKTYAKEASQALRLGVMRDEFTLLYQFI